MMTMMDTKKGVMLVYTLVKKFAERAPNIQVGKTVIQKMMYLLGKELKYDFDFSMYHYGPYSPEISMYLGLAEDMGLVEVKWDTQCGYIIKPKSNKKVLEQFENAIIKEEVEKIIKLVEEYVTLSPLATRLSIIATAVYIMDKFNVRKDKVVNVIKTLKPTYEERFIEETLKKSPNHILHETN